MTIRSLLSQRWCQITILVLLALALRLYQFSAPLADWHSFRQADTASVAWEYYQAMSFTAATSGDSFPCGFRCLDLLRPHYQDVSNIQSGQDNPEGWRMVEMPLVNALVAAIMYLARTDQIVAVYRAVDIGFALLSIIGLYLLAEKLSHRRLIAFLSAFFLTTLPYAVFYSRSILPEVPLITSQIYTLLFFYDYLSSKTTGRRVLYFTLTFVTLSLSLLIKPVAAFIAPLLIYLALMKYKNQVWRQWPLALFALTALPLLAWRLWIQNFPTGVPVSTWLLQGQVKAFSFTWFRWLLAERSVKLLLGFFGTIIAGGALIKRSQRRPIKQMTAFDGFCLIYAACNFLFLAVFATGNVQHDYYQNFMLPFLVLVLAKGVTWLIDRLPAPRRSAWREQFRQPLTWLFLVASLCLQITLFWLLSYQDTVDLGQTIGWRFYLLIALLAVTLLLFVFNDQLISRFRRHTWAKYLAPAFSLFFLLGLVGDYLFLRQKIGDFYHINHPTIIAAGAQVQALTPPHSLVIAPYFGDTTFLFQTRRRGWPLGFDIADKIDRGAQYYVSVNYDDEAHALLQEYQPLLTTPDYLIIDLTKKNASASSL